MTERIERTKWLTPGLLIQVATTLIMLGGSWGIMSNRIEVVLAQNNRMEQQIADLRGDIRTLQNAQNDVVRAQEQMAALKDRILNLERFQSDQVSYNTRFLSAISRIER